MKNKVLKITILTLIIIMFMQVSLLAVNTLKLDLTTSESKIKVGEKVKIKVSWNQGMQAADFYLIYDSKRLEFIEADISNDYINNKNAGQLRTAWFSMDDTDKTQIEYTFKAKKSGTVNLETNSESGGFATGELRTPRNYKEANLTIEISSNPISNVFKAIGIIIGIIVALILIRIIINIRIEKSKKKFR